MREMRKRVLIVGGKKQGGSYIKIALGSDFPARFADPARGIKAKKAIEINLLSCDFQCSLADCGAKFKFAHLCGDIPFAVVRYLPVDKRTQPQPAFSLSFFKAYDFSPSQEKIIAKLRSSGYYSRNLISRLNPGQTLFKVFTLQNEIVDGPNGKLDLGKASEIASLSRYWLSHKFREISGLTLESFILINHLCLALWKIVSTGKLIKTIAFDLGYKPGSFSERFKEQFGVPPSFIRNNVMIQ